MKYIDKYNNLKNMEVVGQHLLYTDKSRICRCCGDITNFTDIGFEAPFCSEECYNETADGYLNNNKIEVTLDADGIYVGNFSHS